MSSTSGGSGISGGSGHNFTLLRNGEVQIPGAGTIDLTTPAGLAEAKALLSTEQLSDLTQLMAGIGFKLLGGKFVPSDEYGAKRATGYVGPMATDAAVPPLYAELAAKVFEPNGLPNPYNANTTPQLTAKLQAVPQYHTTVKALQAYLKHPTAGNQSNYMAKWAALKDEYPYGNVMETLEAVFAASIQDMNKDKAYYLYKLQDYNKMAQALSDYLNYMTQVAQNLSAASVNQSKADEIGIAFDTQVIDLSTLDQYGNVQEQAGASINGSSDPNLHGAAAPAGHCFTTGQGVDAELKKIEAAQTTLGNKREMASNAFQDFDQKSNQLYNLLASVVKVMNDMRTTSAHNMM